MGAQALGNRKQQWMKTSFITLSSLSSGLLLYYLSLLPLDDQDPEAQNSARVTGNIIVNQRVCLSKPWSPSNIQALAGAS